MSNRETVMVFVVALACIGLGTAVGMKVSRLGAVVDTVWPREGAAVVHGSGSAAPRDTVSPGDGAAGTIAWGYTGPLIDLARPALASGDGIPIKLNDSQVVLMVGQKPDGNAGVIKVDHEGRVFCAPVQK